VHNELSPLISVGASPVRWSQGATGLLLAGIPEATRRAYRGDRACWTAYADAVGAPVLPAESEMLAAWAAELLLAGSRAVPSPRPLAASTVARRLAAISIWHRERGHGVPDLRASQLVLRGHRRQQPRRRRQAAPITREPLRALVAQACAGPGGRESNRALRDKALMLLGFGLAARRSELVRVSIEDLTITADGLLVQVIRAKVTDEPRPVAVPWAADPDLCAARAVLRLRTRLVGLGFATGPLFRRVHRGDHVQLAGLSPAAVNAIVRGHADGAALPLPDSFASWSAHGLRRGMASAARAAGADPLTIGRHGAWADGSAALWGYLHDADRWEKNALSGVL
jgi:integrase